VGRAIESALAQTTQPGQIIVVDDGSTDNTEQVCAKFSERIRFVRQPNLGVSAARNCGIRLAGFPWTAFLDSDDYWSPTHLEKIGFAIESTGGKAHFYFTDMQFPGADKNNSLWSKIGLKLVDPFLYVDDATALMLMSWQPCSIQCSVFNTGVLRQSGGFDPRFRVREDTEIFSRLGIGSPVCLVNNLGCIQTADENPQNRLSELIHTRSETYWQLECLLCNSLISRFPNLKPEFREILDKHLAIAYWRLSRLNLRSGRLRSGAETLFLAFAIQPTFLKEVVWHNKFNGK
jgi:glycosyltransferase involved in cell wall biosynthesis